MHSIASRFLRVAPSSASFARISAPAAASTPRSLSLPRPRCFHSSAAQRAGFDEFFQGALVGRTGREWKCADLRLKSFDDLHKLWFVLLKERNMLHSYKQFCRSTGQRAQNEERFNKVKKSMAHIKMVLGERYRQVKEETEPENSTWRVAQEKKRAAKREERLRERRARSAPKQVHPQKENHPKRKKIAFRNVKPRIEGAAPASVAAASEPPQQQQQQATSGP